MPQAERTLAPGERKRRIHDIVTCARRGWDIFARAWSPLLIAGLIWTIVNAPLQWLLIGPALYSLFLIALRSWRGETPELGDVLAGFRDFGTTLIAGLLFLAPFAAWGAVHELAEASEAAVAAATELAGRTETVVTLPEQALTGDEDDDLVNEHAPPIRPAAVVERAPLSEDVAHALETAPRPGVPLVLSLAVLVHGALLLFLFPVLAERRCGLGEALRGCVALAETTGSAPISGLARQVLFGVPIVLVVTVLGMLTFPGLDVPFLLIGAVPLGTCFATAWYVERAHPDEARLRDTGAEPGPAGEQPADLGVRPD